MSTCCDPTCGQSINVKSARHMHQNRGRPAPKPRATHPNSAGPQLPQFLSHVPPIQTPCVGPQLLSRVPPIQTPCEPPAPELHASHSKTTACCRPPAPEPRASHPKPPRATSILPPIQHPNSAGPQLQSHVPPSQTPRPAAPEPRATHPARRVPFSSEERTPTVPFWGIIYNIYPLKGPT